MKNALRIIAVVLVAALVFAGGYGLGSSKGITVNVQVADSGNNNATVDTNTTPVTTQPAATEPAATQPAATEPAATEPAKTEPAKTDDTTKKSDDSGKKAAAVPSSISEIVAAYNKAINATKKATTMTAAEKSEKVTINVDDCSFAPATGALNSILKNFMSDYTDHYTVSGDTATKQEDGGTKSLDSLILPSNREAALTEGAVASATCDDNGGGSYTLHITLASEKSTFDGTNTVKPVNNDSVVDVLNLADMDVKPAQITQADMTYPGTVLDATVNANGLLDALDVKIPMEGSGTGKLIASLSVTLSGEFVDHFKFTY